MTDLKQLIGKVFISNKDPNKKPMRKLYKRLLIAIGLIPILVINNYVFDSGVDLTEILSLIVVL